MKLQITGCKGNKGPEDSSPGKPGNGKNTNFIFKNIGGI